jgi:2-polyprenyl-3-methyl-5-hydroxy-6-metoxy-1,4-benzoquinol methylase
MSAGYYAEPRPDVRALVEPAGHSFLDVGCAEGAFGEVLKRAGATRVAGIEMSSEAARRARDRLDVVVEGDITKVDLPFEPAEFDYLVFADVLEHTPEPEAVLRRLLPFLKPDGRVVVSVPNMRFYLVLLRLIFDRWSYADSGVRDRTHLRIITRRSLVRMLEEAGLEVERLERNYRLVENQSQIGRFGALASRVARRTVAPLFFRDLMAYQYLVVARPCTSS